MPLTIQQQVRDGKLRAQLAMKYLVPVARVNLEDCARMASAFVQQHCNPRQAGQLYAAWREGTQRSPRAHLGRAGTVFENAAAVAGQLASRSGARPGDSGCHPASRRSAACRSPARDGSAATEPNAKPDRKRTPGTG